VAPDLEQGQEPVLVAVPVVEPELVLFLVLAVAVALVPVVEPVVALALVVVVVLVPELVQS